MRIYFIGPRKPIEDSAPGSQFRKNLVSSNPQERECIQTDIDKVKLKGLFS